MTVDDPGFDDREREIGGGEPGLHSLTPGDDRRRVERGLLGEVVGRAVDPQAAGVDVGLAGAAERRDDGFGDRSVELRRGAVTRCGGARVADHLDYAISVGLVQVELDRA